jgi:multidrug efflux pump subunit AcrA (membrane-fusion protein)
VTVAIVRTQDVSPQTRYIGRVEAVQSVDLRARVEGVIEKVAFQEGRQVKQDQLLYQIEQDTYQAAVAHAEAALQSAQATLKNAAINQGWRAGRPKLDGRGRAQGRRAADCRRPPEGTARHDGQPD